MRRWPWRSMHRSTGSVDDGAATDAAPTSGPCRLPDTRGGVVSMTGLQHRWRTDTVVIGAGAAGLAAASELARAGRRCIVLEARDRVGGRVCTLVTGATNDDAQDTRESLPPLELGAEFIHGESPVTRRWLETSGQVFLDAASERWVRKGHELRRADGQFEALKRCLGGLPTPSAGASFAEYLAQHRRRVPADVRRFAVTLVEGFDAADPARIDAREVIEEWSGPAAADQAAYRPLHGYGALVEAMRASLPSRRVRLLLDAVVERVHWQRGRVEVQARHRGSRLTVQARHAVVTLPLGVLQSAPGTPGHVVFDPPLVARTRALQQLHSGPVVKVVLRFRRPFWAGLAAARYRNAAFFFSPGSAFPTFWTALPWRVAQLVAWSAGPNAKRLEGCTEPELRRHLYASLATLFGRRPYDALLERLAWHDWQADPYARGAYSYVGAGGSRARAMLSRPLAGTLYFAGEACDTGDEPATVGGALRSGACAVHRLLRAGS